MREITFLLLISAPFYHVYLRATQSERRVTRAKEISSILEHTCGDLRGKVGEMTSLCDEGEKESAELSTVEGGDGGRGRNGLHVCLSVQPAVRRSGDICDRRLFSPVKNEAPKGINMPNKHSR